jgi:tRNA (mo5U34)-methyltransferase
MTKNELTELRRKVAAKPFWYHRIELPGGIVTPGWAPVKAEAYRIPDDLTGKRVLDVGAWDGYWTFQALQRGARQVVAIDDFSDYLGTLADRREWENFDLCRSALGYDQERCQRISMSAYDVTPAQLGKFDVVFFFGTIYHLRHPLLALDRLSAVCTDEMFVESAICDEYSPYRGGYGKGYDGEQMIAEFYPTNEYAGNVTNWWVPTLYCLSHMVLSSGFAAARGWKLTDRPEKLVYARGFVHASKKPREQEQL